MNESSVDICHLILKGSESSDKFASAIPAIENFLRERFFEMQITSTFDDAGTLFQELDEIQLILAKVVFQNDLTVNIFIRDFIYDFDRVDDLDTRIRLYKEIKLREL